MELKRDGDRLIIVLPEDATILNVEEDFLKINDELVINSIKSVTIDTSLLKEIDTAYLQFVLSIMNTILQSDHRVNINANSVFDSVLDLYGITLREVSKNG